MKKLILTALLTTFVSTGVTGCLLSHEVLSSAKPQTHQKFIYQYKDSVASFVFDKQQNKLLMIGDNYVYVFDDNEQTERLKAILNHPKLDTKRMSWNVWVNGIYNDVHHNSIKIDENNQFWFGVKLSYEYQNDAEAEFFKSLNFNHSSETGLVWVNERDTQRTRMTLTGKMYQDQSAITQRLRSDAKALSKRYQFMIGRMETERDFSGGAKIALLPFALATDIITAPLQWAFAKGMQDY